MTKRSFALAAILCIAATSSAQFSFFKEYKNVDARTFAVGGLRDTGVGTIDVSGISGTVVAAYLWWNDVTTETPETAGDTVLLDGTPVTGTTLGYASSNCWDYAASVSFRANVTALVAAKRNGLYLLSDVGDSAPTNGNGASLIVIYDDGNSWNNVDVRFYDGNDSIIDSIWEPGGWDITLAAIPYNGTSVDLEVHVSDGQGPKPKYGDYLDGPIDINGINFLPNGQIFAGDSVPSSNDGPLDNGNLWDVKNWDVTSFFSPGLNALLIQNDEPFFDGDCYGMTLAAIRQPVAPACPGIQLANLLCGPDAVDPFDGELKRVFRPGEMNIDGITLLDIFNFNGIRFSDRTIIQAVRMSKVTPVIKCTAFVSGPGAGENTNFDTGYKFANVDNLNDPFCNVVFQLPPDAECLGCRCLLFSPPCTTYTLSVIYLPVDEFGFPTGPPQTISIQYTVAMPTRETIRCNIEYFSTVAAGVTQKCKITQDVVDQLLACLEIPNDLEALFCIETVIATTSIDFVDLLATNPDGNYDVRFKHGYLVDSDEEPIGCLLLEMANALLFHP